MAFHTASPHPHIPDFFAFYVDRGKGRFAKRPQTSISPRFLREIEAVSAPLAVFAAGILTYEIYFRAVAVPADTFSFYLGTITLVALLSHFIFVERSVHDASNFLQGRLSIRQIVVAVSLAFISFVCIFYLLNIAHLVSRGWLAAWYVTTIISLIATRGALVFWARKLKFETRLNQNVAIFGRPDLARTVAQQLHQDACNRYSIALFSDVPPRDNLLALPFSGGMDQLIACAQAGACDHVILALPQDESLIRSALDRLAVLPIEVQLAPDAMVVTRQAHGAEVGNGLLLLNLQKPPVSERGTLAKAALDYTLASVAIVVLAPLMLLVALAIKLDSRGPVFFVQSRHGYNNRIIRVFKFRTMTCADDGPVVLQASRNDVRVTRVGRLLRRTSLDELPQLFNVLRGELSLVGPRPHAVCHNEFYAASLVRYTNRHKVKPGITGWAQVNGCRGATESEEAMRKRLDLDLFYINQWTLWLDIKILARTLAIPFYDHNAY